MFAPLLAGGTLRDRLIACLGALVGIAATAFLWSWAGWGIAGLPLLAGPVGASAVLLFALPASPMAQPWPIIGGSTISAIVGVAVAHLIGSPVIAAGVAVALAILAMSMLRCLHPPGGAVALLAVVGGPAISAAGYRWAFMPIAANEVVLVMAGWCFHRFSGHSYPHRAPVMPRLPQGIERKDVDSALAELGETFDISHEDLDLLLRRAASHAEARRAGFASGAPTGR